jgi:hypothetical protein
MAAWASAFEDAITRLEPLGSDGFVPIFVGRALTFAGRVTEALAHFESMGNPKQGVPAWYALALVRAGRREEAEELARIHHQSPHRALFIAAALGDLDRAFEALDQEANLEPQRVPIILTYPELAVLQADPRLLEIRRRFRLPT